MFIIMYTNCYVPKLVYYMPKAVYIMLVPVYHIVSTTMEVSKNFPSLKVKL